MSDFDESSGVVTVQVEQNKAALLRHAQLVDAALDELVGGHFLIFLEALLVGLAVGYAQRDFWIESVVQLHQWVTPPKGPP